MRVCVSLIAALMCCGAAFPLKAEEPGDRYRPQLHFSPQKNWTNDPNGLIYFEGEYHLFFQYNPFGDKWGHMSWGHAVSRDLLRWQQLPVALPESDGVMIFTGSTVIDERNSSGFCAGGKPCMVAIYTGHTPEAKGKKALQTQNLAYSNDRGRSWTKYKGNPVLDRHMSDFRDPKVFWSEASKRWVLAVALPDDHKVLVYHSTDLKKWAQVSEFGPAGATGGQWECPELFETPIEGKSETRWVMKVGLNPGGLQGGSGEQYFVGNFDGTKFTNDNKSDVTLWTDYGKDCYCALTFNNLPKTQRVPVVIGWMDNWQYAADLPTAPPFRGQMTLPRELMLRQTTNGLRLVQRPTVELQKLRVNERFLNPLMLDETLAVAANRPGRIFEAEVELKGMGTLFELALGNDKHKTLVTLNRLSKKLSIDRTNSGITNFSKDFPGITEAPLDWKTDRLMLHFVVDRNSMEVFADDGLVTVTNLIFHANEGWRLYMNAPYGSVNPIIRLWDLKP